MTLQADCEREIVAFHEFIEGWLAGRVKEYDRTEAVLPDEFEIVSPSGERRSGTEIRSDLRAGHGAFADSDPAFEIRVEDVETRFAGESRCLVTYEEWQRQDGEWEGRVSSALFRRVNEAPNGVEWVHLHETWCPEEAEPPNE